MPIRTHVPIRLPELEKSKLSMTFNELVRLLERNGLSVVKEKGSIRYYGKPGIDRLIRLDYHGSREVPTGTCHAILKAAGLKGGRIDD